MAGRRPPSRCGPACGPFGGGSAGVGHPRRAAASASSLANIGRLKARGRADRPTNHQYVVRIAGELRDTACYTGLCRPRCLEWPERPNVWQSLQVEALVWADRPSCKWDLPEVTRSIRPATGSPSGSIGRAGRQAGPDSVGQREVAAGRPWPSPGGTLPRAAVVGQAGLMLALRWKTLPASYLPLIAASRSYLGP
jgi:hypothetical protein